MRKVVALLTRLRRCRRNMIAGSHLPSSSCRRQRKRSRDDSSQRRVAERRKLVLRSCLWARRHHVRVVSHVLKRASKEFLRARDVFVAPALQTLPSKGFVELGDVSLLGGGCGDERNATRERVDELKMRQIELDVVEGVIGRGDDDQGRNVGDFLHRSEKIWGEIEETEDTNRWSVTNTVKNKKERKLVLLLLLLIMIMIMIIVTSIVMRS